MSTFPWLNHGSLIQSRSVWTEACAGAEGSARDIAPALPSLGGKNGIERLVLLPTSVSDLSWCFGSMYKNPYKCYVKRLDDFVWREAPRSREPDPGSTRHARGLYCSQTRPTGRNPSAGIMVRLNRAMNGLRTVHGAIGKRRRVLIN